MRSEEARQQAQAERLMLVVAENKTGYFGVKLQPGRSKPYLAQVWRGGKDVRLGNFATAEEAALCYARTPDAKAQRAHGRRLLAFAPGMTAEAAMRAADAEELGQSSRPVAPSPG